VLSVYSWSVVSGSLQLFARSSIALLTSEKFIFVPSSEGTFTWPVSAPLAQTTTIKSTFTGATRQAAVVGRGIARLMSHHMGEDTAKAR